MAIHMAVILDSDTEVRLYSVRQNNWPVSWIISVHELDTKVNNHILKQKSPLPAHTRVW